MDDLIERNVLKMMDYREDAGYSAISQVEAYWEALRGGRLMPKRSEIDPRGIESALEYTFVLERIAIGIARLRIAGSHLNNLMGMEVRGMPITSFIAPSGRRQMSDMLEEVFQRPSVCQVQLAAEVGRNKPAMDARMLLLPLKSDFGDVSRVLGCLIARGKPGNHPRRFNIVGTKVRPIIESSVDAPEGTPLELEEHCVTMTGFNDPIENFTYRPRTGHKPYLRLIKSDD